MGFDAYNIGPELEYFYFKDARPEGGVPEILDEGGYFDLTTLDAGSDVRRETILALEQLGIHVEYAHHEVGPSQHEVDMRYKDALAMSDDCMTYRIVVKEYAMKYGWHATFMPKPLFNENGSGMHVHQSLSADGRNAFYDADDQYFLSPTAKSFIAGQLRHAREIAPLFAQWVNSYKRLVPGYEAPVYLAWSRRNRSALIRVPLYHPGKEQATRAELRCPDPACNPYLCFAGMLHAGLEGIEHGYELPEPMEQNLYHLTPEERAQRGIEQLPETLGEAIEIAAESELVLRVLGEHTFKRFIEIKREEWEEYRVQVRPGSSSASSRSSEPALRLADSCPRRSSIRAVARRCRPAGGGRAGLSREVRRARGDPPAVARRLRPAARRGAQARAPVQPPRRRPLADPAAGAANASRARSRSTATGCRWRRSTPTATTCSGGWTGWCAPTTRWSSGWR